MSTAKPYEVISEEEFDDRKDPAKVVRKVLVHVRLKDGLVKTMAFPKVRYGLSTRDRLITEYLEQARKPAG